MNTTGMSQARPIELTATDLGHISRALSRYAERLSGAVNYAQDAGQRADLALRAGRAERLRAMFADAAESGDPPATATVTFRRPVQHEHEMWQIEDGYCRACGQRVETAPEAEPESGAAR
jgi:hypothetical protein